jgi:hypothetical protein
MFACALVPMLAMAAVAQDDAPKPRPETKRYASSKQDSDGNHVAEITFKDNVTYQVKNDIPEGDRRKIDSLVLGGNLMGNDEVTIYLVGGQIVAIEKGAKKNQFDQLAPALQKQLKESQEGDEVKILHRGSSAGKFKKLTDEGVMIEPKVTSGNTKGFTETIPYKEIKVFTNLTQQAKANPANGGGQQANNDVISRLGLKVGDTVRIGFVYGQIVGITEGPEGQLMLHEWKGNNWADNRPYKRAELTEITLAPLELRRSYPVNNMGEVVVKEEKSRVGARNQLNMKGSVSHDQNEFILVGASLVFAAGPQGTDFNNAPLHEDVPVPPVFGNELWHQEKTLDQEDGQVTIYFDPAKNLVSARAPEAKRYIVTAFASKDRDSAALARVYAAAALNGDPDLALLLVAAHSNVPSGPEQERIQGTMADALVQFGDAGSKALLEHIKSPDGTFQIPIAKEDGSVTYREQKEQASYWKKYELKLLANIPGAAAGERGRQLFSVYEEKGPELGEAVVKVFQARTAESIDSLLDVGVQSTTGGTDVFKRAEDAATILKSLGESGFNELITRVKQLGPMGQVEAKKLTVALQGGKSLPDVIGGAIQVLVEAKKGELHAKLVRTLDDAKGQASKRNWEDALSMVNGILDVDPTMEEAKKLKFEALIHVADKDVAEKKRGDAAKQLRKVIDAGQKGRGAESRLAQIMLEACREDLEGNCIRRDADECSEVLSKANKGDHLNVATAIKSSADGWFPVKISEKDSGFIAQDAVEAVQAGAQLTVREEFMRPDFIKKQVAEIRKLAPECGAACDQIEGELWIRDALMRYEEGGYNQALASFGKARELIPNDPRLSKATLCWVKANAFLLLIFIAVVVVAGVALFMAVKGRQRRIRVAEFKYYGKDRVRVEREIDGASAAPADAPADAPAPVEPPSAPPA